MTRMHCMLSCVGVSLAVSFGHAAQFAMEYRSPPSVGSEIGYVSSQGLAAAGKEREKLTAEPSYRSQKPLYFSVKLGTDADAVHTVVLDESGGTGAGHDTLYVDANNNEDLTDDQAVKGRCRKSSSYQSSSFPAAEVRLKSGGEVLPYRFTSRLYAYPRRTTDASGKANTTWRFSFSLYSACYYRGRVQIGDESYEAALVDVNSNGVFNDYFSISSRTSRGRVYATGDRLLLDLNRDGRFDRSRRDNPEAFGWAKHLALGGRFYELSAGPDGRRIEIAPAAVKLGSLKRAGGGDFTVGLGSGDGIVQVQSREGIAVVPVGTYTLYSCKMERTDKNGNPWKLVGYGTDTVTKWSVAEAATTEAVFGPPLRPLIQASTGSRQVKPGSRTYLRLSILGEGGEVYSAGDISTGKGRPPAPTFEVGDEGGTAVAQGSFRYG